MQELRFVAVSEDGSYAVLAVPGRSARFTLPIDERLRAVALGQTSRLAQYEIEVESPLRPKEIQARIRAGETAEEIADAAGIPLERVRWFEGPVLAERGYIAEQAQTATVRRLGDSAGQGPRLGDIVTERISASGADPEDGQWDSRKRGDGSWQVQLTFSAGGRLHIAEWVFDPRRRHVMPEDDNAARLSLPESELPPLPATMPGEATVTPIAPRLGAAAGMSSGMGAGMGSGGGRFRPEHPGIADPPVAAPPAASRPAPAAFYEPDRHAAPAPLPPAAERATTAPWVVTPAPGVGVPEFDDDPAPALATPAEPAARVTPEPAALQETPAAPAASVPQQGAEPTTADKPSASSKPEPAVKQEPAAAKAEAPAKTETAAKDEATVKAETAVESEPTAKEEPAEPAATPEDQPARPRPDKKNARGRRSSVPSWDEIMLGSSRQRD
jgi:hypothetical protein